jgi:cysteine dioxygenase
MELFERLEQTFSTLTRPSMSDLKHALMTLTPWLDQITASITDPGQQLYGRHLLLKNENVEVVVIHLPAGRSTPIHDHGHSIGCAWVIEGDLLDISFALDDHGYPENVRESRAVAGEILEESHGQIHRLTNPGRRRMISLHAYAPPIQNSNKYIPYQEVLDFVI